MSTPTLAPAPSPASTGAEPRASFGDLLAAEWIKLWSLRSIPWVLLLSASVIVIVAARGASYTYDHFDPSPAAHYYQTALTDSFNTIGADVVMLVAGGLGAFVVVNEYASGLIRTSLAAVPDRRALLLAKALVLTAVVLGWGAAVAGTSFGIAQAILSGRGIGLSITDPGAFRFVAGAALFAPVCALVGLCLGVLIRHTAASIVSTILVLFFVPAFFTDTYRWSADISHALPFTAWRRLSVVDLRDQFVSPYPATVTSAWIAFAVWSLASVAIAALAIQRRDH
ncbi:ABC transporter permease [Kitasatospora aureofaciens]|uniref:ABC transporter permease n=1 Tax=Kitasatospora aureofaciens TaxID=1894 RepID=UPI001C46526C|nr:ABC transporter permease [Kitasatospora aureofaciens]MBV6697748.1 ABC transporter permease [Kitasatospora aureofaciens]